MKKILIPILLSVLTTNVSFAQYPEQPITYTIPFKVGDESDVTARLQQEGLQDLLSTDIVIQNYTGRNSASALIEFKDTALPNGYEVISVNLPQLVMQPLFRPDTGYATEDFDPLHFFQFAPSALVVREDSEFATLADLITFAQENPIELTVGGSGNYGANHLDTLRLSVLSESELTYIPFPGSAATYPALLGSHVSALMTHSTAPFTRDGMRVLAVASEERLPFLPDTPTFRELGYDIVGGTYLGVAVPPETPEAVKTTLIEAFETVTQNTSARYSELGYLPVNISGDEIQALSEQMLETYQEIIEAGLE